MNVGILGGSFDPPHIGHLLVARQTHEIMHLDEVWFMPYFSHAWDKSITDASERLAMTKLLVEKGIRVSDEEVKQSKKNYCIDTVRIIRSRYSHNFYWIVGSDIVPEFPRWKDPEALAQEVSFYIFPRNGHPMPAVLPKNCTPVVSPDLVTTNISSTIVRNRLQKGLSVIGLIPDAVLEYINEHQLYKG
jgi:nicotinate-nucleotide adenylyltransferase